MTTKRALAIGAGLVALAAATIASARPGGGNSYSGGGGFSSGHSSGGGGGAGLVRLLIELVLYYPQIGIPVVCLLLGGVAWNAYKDHHNKDWDSGPPVALKQAISLDALRQHDQNFSQPVFEDFVFRLYAAVHRARHSAEQLATLAPYVDERTRRALVARAPNDPPVRAVVIGAMRTVALSIPDETAPVTVELELEANLAAHDTAFVVESWTLERANKAKSKPPQHTKIFPCPNCGAPWASKDTGSSVCASCGQAVDNGRFDWVVTNVVLRSSDARGPTLTQNVEERGTDLPTIRAHHVDRQVQKLAMSDPGATPAALDARLALIYRELYAAWARNDLAPARGFVSDGLYDYLQYWIDMYTAQGLRNELVDMRIESTTIARVVHDRYYYAVVIRIFASGLDFTVDASGKVVAGSKSKRRAYSEYWTLIRSVAKTGETKREPVCGNCGAPIEINQAGECVHCKAHVTAGEFDWVLSKIEQDDSYRG